uniref:Uncharacterized protein n=1 Tax=Lactuca sativa TaxID=4236 RepID=A0A9R1VEM3_LACSA|nr:hypothetical protein LSAT_V11C500288840 [Lactuca sativa]
MFRVVGTIIKDYFSRLSQSQRALFEASPFGRFLGMHVPNGNPLLVHLMMLHEVRSQEVFESGRFMFELQGMQLDFGEIEYILFSVLRVGPYLFPNITDARLQLKDLQDYIMSPNYLTLQDEDTLLFIHLVFMLKGLHGRDVKTGIPAAVYKLTDNIYDWNIIFKQPNPESKKVHKCIVAGFMLSFKHHTYLFSIDMDFGDVPRGNINYYVRMPT